MALTQSQVSQLYVTLFGRASEGAGNTYWQTAAADLTDGATQMLTTQAAQDYFGSSLDTDQAFIEYIYLNTLGKTYAQDEDGVDYWVAQLAAGATRGEVTASLIEAVYQYADSPDATTKAAYDRFVNRVEVSDYCADNIEGADLDANDAAEMAVFTGYISGVTDDDATVTDAEGRIDANADAESTFTLTAGTDVATANLFEAPMVYSPDGSDRMLSLQDEDILTGTAGLTNNTLNATMGNINADEGTTATVTPRLVNIQNVNIDWTGNTNTLDLRNADAIEALHIDRITADATTVTVDNITTAAADLRVANTASDNTNVLFRYQRGVLTGDETMDLELNDVLAATITQDARGTGALVEGFETVNLLAVNGVDISNLTVNEMETLIVTGSDYLDIISLTATAGVGATTPEYDLLGAAGINNPSAVGLLTLDASAFEGDLTLDISNSVGVFSDPDNSGAIVHGTVTGGIGDDTFWSAAGLTATSATNRFVIDGGDGANTLILTAGGVAGNASVSNIQALELRDQIAGATAFTVDFDAFDDTLASVLLRTESTGATTYNLNDMGADLAESGDLVLRHGITGAGLDIVNVRLKDASGADDTVAITVENDLNTGTTFDYTLDFDGDDADGDSFNTDGVVENVTIADNDTESNSVTLTKAQEQTGTLTLTGGVDGDTYTVVSSLVAETIEASEQLSDLRLTVGDTVGVIDDVTQTINLGQGDDILTFQNIDDFDTVDTITDAGGTDTVRAAFSDDATLSLTDIENLHIIATDNVTLGMAGADVDQLVILADIAADGSVDDSPETAEPFNVAAGVAATDIITLTDTSLTELNFFADLDTDDDNTAANRILAEAAAVAADPTWTGIGSTAVGDAAYKGVINDESLAAVFNGVTLSNNTANALTVNINSSLDDVIYGATSYTLGQLTAHGITSMDIQISDEDVTAAAANALTTINNIYAKNMTSLSVTAADDVTLGTVSGAALNNSLLIFDASAVGGDLNATVISLGDDADVILADGDNIFSALGSAGKDITITAGDGDNTITGSGQDDTITTGSGWDIVSGDRGDNVISTGSGNDTVSAKDGNDTYDVGSGIDTVVDNDTTGIDASLATNTVSMSGGVTSLSIDVDGLVGYEVDQMLAVGDGSDLTLSWLGGALQTGSAVLDGRLADVNAAVANDANSNLDIITNALDHVITGLGGNDVVIVTDQTTASINFAGGAGNDAAVGGVDCDIFTGGTGADKLVMQNTAAIDTVRDTVVISDGDSTATAWDVIVGLDAGAAASGLGTVAGSATAGSDVLDLAFATIAGATVGTDGTDSGDIESHAINASGLVTFDDVDAYAASVMVGTAANQLSLTDALAYLATNLNGTSSTVLFQYDSDGDAAITAADSAFIFQDGAVDTVVELVGVYTGLEAAGGVVAGLVTIA